MKIGVSSYSYAKYQAQTRCNDLALCDLSKKFGFDGIEFTELTGTADAIQTAKEIKAHCDEIGLEISAYAVGADFLAEDIEKEKEHLRYCLQTAKALGAPIMRHDVAYSLKKGPRYTWREAIADMAPHIREIAAEAASLGIRTCTENHGYVFQDPQRVEQLILAVNHPNYGWLFDMGNFLCVDADPIEALRIAEPYLFHVHAKDFLVKPADCIPPEQMTLRSAPAGNYLCGTIVGHGAVPIVSCITALQRNGYAGYLSLEFEGLEENLIAIEAGHNYLRKVVDATKPV